jgi:hypothetical protein
MSQKLAASFQIQNLAGDLGLDTKKNPVTAILKYCDERVKDYMSQLGDCSSLLEMLDWLAGMLSTSFEIIRNDNDLQEIKKKYLYNNESIFAKLDDYLSGDQDFGVTFRLQHREEWESQYVSIIDCRGDKAARAYFTKWHEVAHLLTLTKQMRLSFRRTHSSSGSNDPEERLMDVLAGRFGFYPPITHQRIEDQISFASIDALRRQLCPEASQQSCLINFSKFWPSPCVLVRAEMGLKKREEAQLNQGGFFFHDGPPPSLRAIRVTCNDAAREIGFVVFPNMRVPENSVIYRTFKNGILYDEAQEDLSSWEASDGRKLPKQIIIVKTRYNWNGVDALLIPL